MRTIAWLLFTFTAVSFSNKTNTKSNTLANNAGVFHANVRIAAATNISVQLTGGANAGTYTASSAEPTCSRGYSGENSFGNQYSAEGKNDKEMSSLQLIVDNYDSAKAGTDQFMVTVGFGKLYEGNSYTISGLDNGVKKGSGTLTIKESGSVTIVSIEGKREEGVSIKAAITCNSVVK